MLDFMDYIQLAFAEGTQRNCDNSYSSLTATTQNLLDFTTPERVRIHLSSLSTPNFATSYTLGTVGLIEGSISYLYSNISFDNTPSKSALIPLRKLAPGYRQVQAPTAPPVESWNWDSILDGTNARHNGYGQSPIGQKATLLHATLHLPPPTTLNALFLRRISPTMQLSLAVSSTRGPPLSKSAPQATLLTQLSHDTGKYSNEYLFSTDNSLFGWRGLWNFGPDPRFNNNAQRLSLLSAGAEAYYSPVSSLIGMSTGLRFSTLPAATSSTPSPNTPISTFPYTLTLTLTPLTGSLSTSYSVRASPNLSFSSRFGFNVYSWESEMVAGFELWRQSKKTAIVDSDGLEWARHKARIWDIPDSSQVPEITPPSEEETQESVLKVRVDQSWNVRLLWEGRVKELLVSAGVGLGPSSFSPSSYANSQATAGVQGSTGGSPPSYWRGVGVSVSYSS
ncbi:mitochondrial distribution and morphology protein 10 [Aspergillus similis]